jgi:hypothetical protein
VPRGDGGFAVQEINVLKFDTEVKRMTTYCGNDCCKECDRLSACGGCERCQGHPFGGSCVAERNKDFPLLKRQLIGEINAFGIAGLAVDDLNLLTGSYVNLPYPLANGSTVRFLKDDDIYLGNQVERADSDRCYGIVANEDFILVCEYGCNDSDPEIVLYTRR